MPIINQVVQGGGTTPTGTITITNNGTYDVTDKATADVQVPTTAPAHYIEKSVDADGKLVNTANFINLTGVTELGHGALAYQYFNVTFPVNTTIDMSNITTLNQMDACKAMFYSAKNITSVDLSGLTIIDSGATNVLDSTFYGCTNLVSVDFSNLTTISATNAMPYCFNNCTNLTSVDFSSLTTVNGSSVFQYMFTNCTSLTGIDLSSLTTVNGSNAFARMFQGCTNLTNIDISSLVSCGSITGVLWFFVTGCTALQTLTFSSLTTLPTNCCNNMCNGCTNLTTLSFPSVTNDSFSTFKTQFADMVKGITGCTVHFPSNTQALIETMTGYPSFGGTNTTVLFDLPATNTLTGADTVTYTRNPKYDTATALAWKVGAYGTTNLTPAYYTSGTTDPAVSDTIYSDAACTTAVTTISAIA